MNQTQGLLAGRYRLLDAIGSGGMGRVWRARDEVLHRAVAIKELTAALYVSESERPRLLARTHAEARAAARINHSAVVTVHDVLDHDERPWIVMELVEGGSLADAVKERGRVEPAESARIGLWVLRALRAAHSAGVLHRDVKPGNVLLATDGRVLLTDFGIAQVEGDTTITRTGEIVGSVDYLAPERIRGQDPGPASDLWALGATLYTAVEGRSPFRRTSPLTTMQAVVEDEPEPSGRAGALGPVITALLRKDPAARPGMDEAEQLLAEAAEGRRPRGAQAYVVTEHVDLGAVTGESATVDRTAYRPQAFPTGPAVTPTPASTQAKDQAPASYPSGGTAEPVHILNSHGSEGGSSGPRRRRRRRTAVLAGAVAAVVLGGAGVVAFRYVDGMGEGVHSSGSAGTVSSPSPDASSTPSSANSGATPSASGLTAGGIPAGWVRIKDAEGFGLALPKGWKRQDGNASDGQVDYTPDNGDTLVRIAVDDSPDFDSAYAHQLDLEQQLQRLYLYKRVSLNVNTFRDRSGSLWDFTWTALAKDSDFPGPRRAIEQTYFGRDGVEYAIYMTSAAADWTATRQNFEAILRSWRQPGA
ncbi:serine/threonine protein kinase [Actinobacteria bacterium OK074]|nr:serine/threonine protein kinase [Actinobacteria bacterium OK074]